MNIPTPDDRLAEEQGHVTELVAQAGTIEVTTAKENDAAAEMLGEIKGRAKDMDALRRSMTRPLDDSKKRIMDLFRPIAEQLGEAEQHIKGAMIEWNRQEERRLTQERATADAERQRLADEATRAMEEGRHLDGLIAAEDSLTVPEPPKAPARAAGTSKQKLWRAEVVDLQALVLAIATGDAPISLIKPDQSAIDALARATKQEGVVFPGVRFWSEVSMRARAAGMR